MKNKRRWLFVASGALLVTALVISYHVQKAPPHFPLNMAAAATPTQGLPLAQYPGVYSFRQTTSMCSTSGVVDNTCTEPTVTLPTAFTTAGTYVITCTCAGGVTGVPVVESVSEAAASPKVQVIIGSMTAVTASCTEVDCDVTSPSVIAQ